MRRRIFIWLQGLLGGLVTALASLRMKVVTDSGTAIGLRGELFDRVVPPGGVGAEIGVYKGTLSRFIVEHNRPRRLYLIDPWWHHESEWHWAVGDRSTSRSLAFILLALREPIEQGQVDIVIDGSTEALARMPDGHLDWAYVDSTHEYEQTQAELRLLNVKVQPSGLICGDDWQDDPTHRHHGVCRAVNEFIRAEPAWRLIYRNGTQWALSRSPGT